MALPSPSSLLKSRIDPALAERLAQIRAEAQGDLIRMRRLLAEAAGRDPDLLRQLIGPFLPGILAAWCAEEGSGEPQAPRTQPAEPPAVPPAQESPRQAETMRRLAQIYKDRRSGD